MVTVNQGTFENGEQAYLFVVDADGEISEGYPAVIGEGGSDTNPPGAPSGLVAS